MITTNYSCRIWAGNAFGGTNLAAGDPISERARYPGCCDRSSASYHRAPFIAGSTVKTVPRKAELVCADRLVLRWYHALPQPSSGGFADHAAAEAALARLVKPAPGSPSDHLMTVGQWLAHWLEGRAAPRFSTLRGYASHVRLYLEPCLGQILLADLRTAHVKARRRGGLR